jgi:hypothetical protein
MPIGAKDRQQIVAGQAIALSARYWVVFVERNRARPLAAGLRVNVEREFRGHYTNYTPSLNGLDISFLLCSIASNCC